MTNLRLLAIACILGVTPLMADPIALPPPAFTFTSQGAYVHKLDRRDLFQVIHPWVPSKAGDFGQMEAQLTIPADAKPPFTLAFYVMDNNYTGGEPSADWVNKDVRVGHRFRQALVNGEVVIDCPYMVRVGPTVPGGLDGTARPGADGDVRWPGSRG